MPSSCSAGTGLTDWFRRAAARFRSALSRPGRTTRSRCIARRREQVWRPAFSPAARSIRRGASVERSDWRSGCGDAAGLQTALVDVAVATSPWIGARALWRARDVSDVFVSFADPGGVGLSALAGMIEPIPRDAPYGLHLQVVDPVDAPWVVSAPLAPGLVVPVGVAHAERLNPGQTVVVSSGGGSIAFDGERDVECPAGQNISVTISPDGPFTIDVDAVLSSAARAGVFIASNDRAGGERSSEKSRIAIRALADAAAVRCCHHASERGDTMTAGTTSVHARGRQADRRGDRHRLGEVPVRPRPVPTRPPRRARARRSRP